jgi:hypothetical protein
MTLTLEITKEQRKRLRAKASRLGLDEAGYLQQLVAQDTADPSDHPGKHVVGKELLEQWEAEGVLGLFTDCPDSPEFARELRNAASRRT